MRFQRQVAASKFIAKGERQGLKTMCDIFRRPSGTRSDFPPSPAAGSAGLVSDAPLGRNLRDFIPRCLFAL
jgi:hypothetical protein